MLRTYDPKSVVMTIGSHIVTGYSEDTFVSIEPTGDGTTATAGADGEVARSLSHNPLHRITLTIQQTSPTNDYLSDLLARDRASGGGGVVAFNLRDLRGSSVAAASQAWVVNNPTLEYSATAGDREWVLDAVMSEDFHVGGNN